MSPGRGPAPFDHRIEGGDLHPIDRHGVDMTGHEQCLGPRPGGRFGEDACPAALTQNRRVESHSPERSREMFRDPTLTPDLGR